MGCQAFRQVDSISEALALSASSAVIALGIVCPALTVYTQYAERCQRPLMIVLQCHSLAWRITSIFVTRPCVVISYFKIEFVPIRTRWGATHPVVSLREVRPLTEEAVDIRGFRCLIEEILDTAVPILRLVSIILIRALSSCLTSSS